MAIAVDQRSASISTSISTLSFTHTITAALSNSILVVCSSHASGSNFKITGINWDALGTPAALTSLGSGKNDTASQGWAEIWYLLNPVAGASKTITITYAGNVTGCAGAISLSGVHQTTPWNAASPQSANGTASAQPSVTVTSATGEAVICCMIDNENAVDTLTVGSGQTTIYNTTVGGFIAGAASDEAGASSVVMDYTGVTASAPWAIIAGSLVPAGAGPTVLIPSMGLLGVGR